MKKQRIAIIGGGISGLAVAYNLLDKAAKSNSGDEFNIDIYEAKGFLGGNADSEYVDLGEIKDPSLKEVALSDNGHLKRIADLGVDDFNLSAYKRIAEIMEEIKFTDYRKLEDTACFFKLDGSKVLTADEKLESGTSDPNTAISQALDDAYSAFMNQAVVDLTKQPEKYKLYTVGEFVDEYISQHGSEKTLLLEMRDCLLYPRINAMYFSDDRTGPAGMPLRAVMKYYEIQEGYGIPGGPDRNYFVNGAQSWIDALAKYLVERYPEQLTIIKHYHASVQVENSKVLISRLSKPGILNQSRPVQYDKVVVTCHADDAMRAIQTGLSQELINVLDKVTYTNSIAVAHTFAGVLAPDKNAWRTYNVLIREGQAVHPYSMTYVMNRHRNDAVEGGKYNKAGMPQYFVTLNPCVPIPDEYVLKTPKGVQRKPAGYFKQFDEDDVILPGWRQLGGDLGEGQPVIGWFKHNVLNFACLEAQEQLAGLQGGEFNNLYFAGGWTKGAGLHEECWQMGEEIANLITGEKQLKSESRQGQPEANVHCVT